MLIINNHAIKFNLVDLPEEAVSSWLAHRANVRRPIRRQPVIGYAAIASRDFRWNN